MSVLSKQVRLPEWWPVAALLTTAALARLSAIYAASALPFFTAHRLDSLVYHTYGARIAAGDWSLGSEVLHMSPGYSYFVGLVYRVFGVGPWAPLLLQAILGTVSVALIYATARRVLGSRPWALAAGAIAALYGPFLFYDSHLLAACLATFAHALLLWLTIRVMATNRLRDWALVGGACGFAALVRPTALLFALPIALAWLIATSRQSTAERLKRLALVAAVTLAVIAPATLRNAIIGGEAVLITDSGGLNFYIGNGPGAIGTFRVPNGITDATNASTQFRAFAEYARARTKHELSSKEVDGFFYGETWSYIADHPAWWARLLLEKAWLFWNQREIPNTYDYTFTREIDPLLSLPFVQFRLIAPFALLGTILLLCRWRSREQVVGLFVAVQFGALVLFFVLAHYRLPAVPVLIVAAVYGARRATSFARQKRYRRLLAATAVIVVALPIVLATKLPTDFSEEYFRLGYAYQVQGRHIDAEYAYLEALAINEHHISAHKNLAHVYLSLGDELKSQAQWRRVGELAIEQKRPEHLANARRALAVWGLTLDEPGDVPPRK